jgi:hypothetical protein
MDLKRGLVSLFTLVWTALAFGAWIYVDQGFAEPFLSVADVPGGSTGAFVGAMVAAVAGWVVLGSVYRRLERADWKQTGREAGLRPAGSGSPPELTGTVDGRTVRARLEKRTVSGTEGSTRQVPYTVVEAELDGPADHGLVGGPADGDIDANIGTLAFEAVVENANLADDLVAVEEQGLVVAGTAETAVRALATGTMGDALRSDDQLNLLSVGDGARVVTSFAEAHNAEMEGVGRSLAEYPVDNLVEELPGDAATATVETDAHIQDGDVLRGQAAAVVAIADVFEEATTPG